MKMFKTVRLLCGEGREKYSSIILQNLDLGFQFCLCGTPQQTKIKGTLYFIYCQQELLHLFNYFFLR